MSVSILDRVYEAYTGEMGQQFMRETQRRIHWICSVVRGESVLDVGCSQGLVPILLGREGKSVVGIDSSAAAIQSADRYLLEEHVDVRKRVSFIEGDFASHDFDGIHFDCIVMGELLEHLLRPERVVQVASRMLQPGSRLVVTVPFGINDHVDHKHTFYLREPFRMLAPSFELVDVVILGKWLGLVGERRATEAVAPSSWTDEQLRLVEAGFCETERALVDEAAGLRTRLSDINSKYVALGEEASRLKREVARSESERKSFENARAELERKLAEGAGQPLRSELAKQISELTAELGNQRDLTHAREVSIARLEERVSHVEQARQKEVTARDSEIVRVQHERADLTAKLRVVELELATSADKALRDAARLETELATLQQSLDTQSRYAEASAERAADAESRLNQLVVQHAEQLQILTNALASKAGEVGALGEQLRVSQERLDSLTQALESKTEQVSRLEARLLSAHELTAASQSLTTELQQRLSKATGELEQQAVELSTARRRLQELEVAVASVDDRIAERERVLGHELREAEVAQARLRQGLERELQNERNRQRELERKMEQSRQQAAAAAQSERRLARQVAQERQIRAEAERKVVQARNTLSFQLGYELIHGFKSRQRFLALPRTLWALQKEAARRRADRSKRHSTPTEVARKPAIVSAWENGSSRQPSAQRPTQLPAALEPAAVQQAQAFTAPAKRRIPELDSGASKLRIACIHDEFTHASLAPECQLLQVSPERFGPELEKFEPDLLFVESAWRGKDDLWGKKISHRGRELVELVDWCRRRGVPSLFWNKEDPVHFGTFVNTAKLFDFVFTTDLDCIDRYKQALGHDRVYLLPFGCQPAQHNPLEKYERKDAICFAGAYYARYPERQEDLASFAASFTASPRLEIYDRNLGNNDPNYAFPEDYRQFIVGTLPFEEIDRAYKGYRYALNLNSIKESQTMFARRVFELLASNTITVSNFSRGIRLLFGDLVITTDCGERALERLRQIARDENHARRFRLKGLRKVLHHHTYGERLRFIASKVWDRPVPEVLPRVVVLAFAQTNEAARSLIAAFDRQTYDNKSLVLICGDQVERAGVASAPDRRVVAYEAVRGTRIQDIAPDARYLASFLDEDYYGKNYLLDLALATRYSGAAVFGKAARFVSRARSRPVLEHDGSQYRPAASLPARAALVRTDVVAATALGAWLQDLARRQLEHRECIATDEFNYCEGGAGLADELLANVEDLADLDEGLALEDLLQRVPERATVSIDRSEQRQISGARLASIFKSPTVKPISFAFDNEALMVHSGLPDEAHEYVYASQVWKPAELGLPKSNKLRLEATPGLNIQGVILFLDEEKQRLGHKLCPAGRNEVVALPDRTTFVQLGLRVYGSGSANIKRLLLDHAQETPGTIWGRSKYLLLINNYPADDDLYRNGFVHRRVVDYRRQGVRVDVFRYRQGEKLGFREFEGIDVINGGDEALSVLLRSNDYATVMVHFLDAGMWQALRRDAQTARLLFWMHGAEVQAWHRRSFNYCTDAEREAAKIRSAKRQALWRNVLCELPPDGKLIFVSKHFADQTLGDLGFPLDHPACMVIHNLIDGDLFEYRPKNAEQRKRVLSVRPYVSRKYANDLSVSAILELSKEPYFDDLSFYLVGDGPLFEDTVRPLRAFSNVRLHQGFLTQRDIAELHGEYGVFLCPTRDDTQGVSRDEAMASGLVPVTNRAGAIPEFVDDECGILARQENYTELADGIARLYEEPELFCRLSENAARRVRQQSGRAQTTARELRLITGQLGQSSKQTDERQSDACV